MPTGLPDLLVMPLFESSSETSVNDTFSLAKISKAFLTTLDFSGSSSIPRVALLFR